MKFNGLTRALLILPTSALLLATTYLFLADIPQDESRRVTSNHMLILAVSCFFSFAGVASASNTMKVFPAAKTFRNYLLTWYGALPFLAIVILLTVGIVAAGMDFASST